MEFQGKNADPLKVKFFILNTCRWAGTTSVDKKTISLNFEYFRDFYSVNKHTSRLPGCTNCSCTKPSILLHVWEEMLLSKVTRRESERGSVNCYVSYGGKRVFWVKEGRARTRKANALYIVKRRRARNREERERERTGARARRHTQDAWNGTSVMESATACRESYMLLHRGSQPQ